VHTPYELAQSCRLRVQTQSPHARHNQTERGIKLRCPKFDEGIDMKLNKQKLQGNQQLYLAVCLDVRTAINQQFNGCLVAEGCGIVQSR